MWKKIKESIVDIVQARTDELKRRVNDARVARIAELEARAERAESDATNSRKKLLEVVNAANAAGWNGVENPKSLCGFVTSLATERDALAAELAAIRAATEEDEVLAHVSAEAWVRPEGAEREKLIKEVEAAQDRWSAIPPHAETCSNEAFKSLERALYALWGPVKRRKNNGEVARMRKKVARELNEAKAKTVAAESECRKARDELAEANKEIIRLKVEYALKRIDPHGMLKVSNKEVIDVFDSAAKKRWQEGGTSREANCAGAIAVAAMVTELALVAQRNPEPTSTLEKVEVK
jgi:hypothetical protein